MPTFGQRDEINLNVDVKRELNNSLLDCFLYIINYYFIGCASGRSNKFLERLMEAIKCCMGE